MNIGKWFENHKFFLFVWGFITSLVFLLPLNPYFLVFIISLAGIPIFYSIIGYEEVFDLDHTDEKVRLAQHWVAIKSLFSYFVGLTVGFIVLYPLGALNYQSKFVSGSFNVIPGLEAFAAILLNNLVVFFIVLVASLFFGIGALYVFIWNASVLGYALASWSFNPYILVHGIPEFLGYFFGALGAGMLTIAILKDNFKGEEASKILSDVLYIWLVGISLIVLGVILEVFLTPTLIS